MQSQNNHEVEHDYSTEALSHYNVNDFEHYEPCAPRNVWQGMSEAAYANMYPHCAQIGFYGDPDLWDIMAGCSSD